MARRTLLLFLVLILVFIVWLRQGPWISHADRSRTSDGNGRTFAKNGTRALELSNNRTRLLCWVPSVEAKIDKHVRAVNETWVPRCDKSVFFINTQKKVRNDTIPLPIEDGRNHLAAKTMAALPYLYQHHGRDYDWFLKGDDDAYVVVENLRFLLSFYDPSTPVYLGHPYKWIVKGGYMSGGASYVLSRAALKLLVEEGIQKNKCSKQDSEDVAVGKCLHDVGVPSHNSLDQFGREAFHPLDPKTHIIGPIPQNQLEQDRFTMVAGPECCSEFTISFHQVNPDEMRIFDHLLYRTSVHGKQSNVQGHNDFFRPGPLHFP